MRVLLPPSESKRPDGGNTVYTAHTLLRHDLQGHTRERVSTALEQVSAAPDAATLLKVGTKAAAEIDHNLRLHTSGTLPAIERYTGVLYDAIDTAGDDKTREWIDSHVWIQSALFGLISANDHIPAYRLSASSRLTEALGATLKRAWNHTHIEWPDTFVLDLRSKDYAALAPLDEHPQWCALNVVTITADGHTKTLNHFNKKAKGQLVTLLARTRAHVHTRDEFLSWAHRTGLDIHPGNDAHTLTLTVGQDHEIAQPSVNQAATVM